MGTLTQILVLCACACALCGGEALAGGRAHGRQYGREYEPYVFAAVPLHAPVPVLHVLSPAPLALPPSARRPAAAPQPTRPHASSIRHTPFTRPYAEPRPYSESTAYAESRPYSESTAYAESRPYVESRPYSNAHPYPGVRPYVDSRHYVESRPYGNARPYVAAVEYEDVAASEYAHGARARPAEYAADYEPYAAYPAGARVALAVPPALFEADAAPYSSQEAVLYARPSLSGGYTYRKIANKNPPPKKLPDSKDQPVMVKIHKHKIVKS